MIHITGLEYLIRERNMSYTKLAKELKVPLETLMLWVKGKKPITKKALSYLSKKFNVEEKFIINIFEVEFLKKNGAKKSNSSNSESTGDHRLDVILQNLDGLFGAMKNE